MSKYIVNTGNRKVVHRAAHISPECKVSAIHPNQMEMTDEDYVQTKPSIYKPCPHCYNS